MLTPVCIHSRIQTGNRAHSRTSGISSACQANQADVVTRVGASLQTSRTQFRPTLQRERDDADLIGHDRNVGPSPLALQAYVHRLAGAQVASPPERRADGMGIQFKTLNQLGAARLE